LPVPGPAGAAVSLVVPPGASPPSEDDLAVLTAAVYEILSPGLASEGRQPGLAAWRFSSRWWHRAQNGPM
jgi:hypothetical protein